QLDRDGADRDIARADRGLGPDALAGRKRSPEEPVHDRARGSLDQRELVSALDLTLNLRFAEDHRLEPGRDAEEMARGVLVAKRVEMPHQLRRPYLGLPREDPKRGRLRLHVIADGEVEL